MPILLRNLCGSTKREFTNQFRRRGAAKPFKSSRSIRVGDVVFIINTLSAKDNLLQAITSDRVNYALLDSLLDIEVDEIKGIYYHVDTHDTYVQTQGYTDLLKEEVFKPTEKELVKLKEYVDKYMFIKPIVAYKFLKAKTLLKTELSKILDEEQYELIAEGEESLTFKDFILMLHLKELDIVNSAGLSHKTKNLFVRMGLRYFPTSNKIMFWFMPQVTKTTFYLKDFFYNSRDPGAPYVHSHVSPTISRWSSSVCYGGNTDLSRAANSLTNDPQPIDDLMCFILNFIDFMHWESMEGAPYRYMQHLRVPIDTASVSKEQVDKITATLLAKLEDDSKREQIVELLEVQEEANGITIYKSPELREFIDSLLPDDEKHHFDPATGTVVNVGGVKEAELISRINRRGLMPSGFVLFKGETYKSTIEHSEPEVNLIKSVHPDVLINLQSKLSQELILSITNLL
jgi:hypothetical protein